MSDQWVVNASLLIVLARAGQLDLLTSLTSEVVVPQAVAVGVQAGPTHDAAYQALAAGQFTVVETPPPPSELIA